MRIRYLGTAAAEGWPALFCNCPYCREARKLGGRNIRTRSQAIIDDTLLIDFPPDTYLHVLRDGLDLRAVRHLLITHTHADHLFLFDIACRGLWYANDVEGVLTVYGNDRLREKYSVFAAGEDDGKQIKDRVRCVEIPPFAAQEIGGYRVTPLLALHDRKERCYLYLIEREGRALLYGNDTGIFPEETWRFLSGKRLDLVSLDCTALGHKEGTNHMGVEDVLIVKQRMLDLRMADEGTRFVVTHFSHNGKMLHEEIVERVKPERIIVAYDGLEVETPGSERYPK